MSSPTDQEQQRRLLAAAIKRRERLQRQLAFDPEKPASRPTAMQQAVIDDFGMIPIQYIVAGTQSGKTQTCARISTWVMTGTHPSWDRPADWGNEPLLCVVLGRTGKQIEFSLLKKIESYLEPGTYKVVRVGNIVQQLEITDGPGKGNTFIFQSAENPAQARERIQSYVAHLSWGDEMPANVALMDELHRRTQARNGYNLWSFTPLVVSAAIQRMVDSAKAPFSRKYQFHMFDNPIYADPERQAKIMADMSTLPEHVRRTRLYGDWSLADSAVYQFDYERMVRDLPPTYHTGWRHLEAVDPALKSALGLTLWAEDPSTGYWYCLIAEKIRGIYDPVALVTHVRNRVQGRHITRRVSDPHEVWYIQTAHTAGISYVGVNKSGRKGDLIKNLQKALGTRMFLTPGSCGQLEEELQEAKWADQAEGRIINGSSYHLLDSSQYACDLLPPWHGVPELGKSPHQWLYEANEKRKRGVEQAQRAAASGRVSRIQMRRRR